jgi:hypothetical protein
MQTPRARAVDLEPPKPRNLIGLVLTAKMDIPKNKRAIFVDIFKKIGLRPWAPLRSQCEQQGSKPSPRGLGEQFARSNKLLM